MDTSQIILVFMLNILGSIIVLIIWDLFFLPQSETRIESRQRRRHQRHQIQT